MKTFTKSDVFGREINISEIKVAFEESADKFGINAQTKGIALGVISRVFTSYEEQVECAVKSAKDLNKLRGFGPKMIEAFLLFVNNGVFPGV